MAVGPTPKADTTTVGMAATTATAEVGPPLRHDLKVCLEMLFAPGARLQTVWQRAPQVLHL